MQPLYKIAEQYKNLYELIDNEEVDQDMLNIALIAKSDTATEKIKPISLLIANYDSFLIELKKSEERINSRRKSIENKIKWLKDYLIENMVKVRINEVIYPEFCISIKENPVSVVGDAIENPEKLPEKYRREKITYSADKIALKKDIEKGEIVDGVSLEKKMRIVIK